MATRLIIHDDDVPIVARALRHLQSMSGFAQHSLHATDDERQAAAYTSARIESMLTALSQPSPEVTPFEVAKALHAGDVPVAERLRDQCYAANPTLPRSAIDLAITNDYLDFVTGNVAPDAHLDDTGD